MRGRQVVVMRMRSKGCEVNRFPKDYLRQLLEDRATIYSGSRAVRTDLVNRTILAAAQFEGGFETNIEENIFLLMHRTAEEDERACQVA